MKANIIGIKGVGMAHAVACEMVGIEVGAILDTDPQAEERLTGKSWVNEWGPYRDEVVPKSRPVFTTNKAKFGSIRGDILIIACPTQYHVPYLCGFGNLYAKILVEKPLSYSQWEIGQVPKAIRDKTNVGHKWMCHPKFPKSLPDPPWSFMQGHKYPPAESHKQVCGVIWDLGVHAAAHLLPFIPAEQWSQLIPMREVVEPLSATFSIERVTRFIAKVYVAYEDIGGGEVQIADTLLPWTDLFALQMERLWGGTHPASFALGAKACELIERISPYHGENLPGSAPGIQG